MLELIRGTWVCCRMGLRRVCFQPACTASILARQIFLQWSPRGSAPGARSWHMCAATSASIPLIMLRAAAPGTPGRMQLMHQTAQLVACRGRKTCQGACSMSVTVSIAVKGLRGSGACLRATWMAAHPGRQAGGQGARSHPGGSCDAILQVVQTLLATVRMQLTACLLVRQVHGQADGPATVACEAQRHLPHRSGL